MVTWIEEFVCFIKIIGRFGKNNLRLLRMGGTILNRESRKNLTGKMECADPKELRRWIIRLPLGTSFQ